MNPDRAAWRFALAMPSLSLVEEEAAAAPFVVLELDLLAAVVMGAVWLWLWPRESEGLETLLELVPAVSRSELYEKPRW